MEIQEKNLLTAYKGASDESKKLLAAMFPDLNFEAELAKEKAAAEADKKFGDYRDIKTIGDARDWCIRNGRKELVETYDNSAEWVDESVHDVCAYLALRMVCAAINDGWEPRFTDDERRYWPWLWLYKSREDYEQEDSDWKATHPYHDLSGVCFGGLARDGAYCGFASAGSYRAPSSTRTSIGSRLCFRDSDRAFYAVNQFPALWADFALIRKPQPEK